MSSLLKELLSKTTESQIEEQQQKRIQELRNLSIDLLRDFGEEDKEWHGSPLNSSHSIFLSLPVKRGNQGTVIKIWTIFSEGLEDPMILIHIPLIQHKRKAVNLGIDTSGEAIFAYREGSMISFIKEMTVPERPSLGEIMQYLSWVKTLHQSMFEKGPDQLPE